MGLTAYGRQYIRDRLGSNITTVAYAGIGSGSGTFDSTTSGLLWELLGSRRAFTSGYPDYSETDVIKFWADWNRVELSGLNVREAGIFVSGIYPVEYTSGGTAGPAFEDTAEISQGTGSDIPAYRWAQFWKNTHTYAFTGSAFYTGLNAYAGGSSILLTAGNDTAETNLCFMPSGLGSWSKGFTLALQVYWSGAMPNTWFDCGFGESSGGAHWYNDSTNACGWSITFNGTSIAKRAKGTALVNWGNFPVGSGAGYRQALFQMNMSGQARFYWGGSLVQDFSGNTLVNPTGCKQVGFSVEGDAGNQRVWFDNVQYWSGLATSAPTSGAGVLTQTSGASAIQKTNYPAINFTGQNELQYEVQLKVI